MSWSFLNYRVIMTPEGVEETKMNQQKIGEFLKKLRKERNLTQEQLAEHFNVSSRTVSRWETGNNLPDLGLLMDLAAFYNIEIQEMIDGERKSENMVNEPKENILKAAEYAANEDRKHISKRIKVMLLGFIVVETAVLLFGEESKGYLYGIVPEYICNILVYSFILVLFLIMGEYMLYTRKIFRKQITQETGTENDDK